MFRRKRVEGKNPFEASMLIDKPDFKVVEASYKGEPFLIAVGTSKQRETKGSGQVGFQEGVKGTYSSQKDLVWELLYNSKILPDFFPIESLKALMTSTVAVTSNSSAVLDNTLTAIKEVPRKTMKTVDDNLSGISTMNIRAMNMVRDSLSVNANMMKTTKKYLETLRKLGLIETVETYGIKGYRLTKEGKSLASARSK